MKVIFKDTPDYVVEPAIYKHATDFFYQVCAVLIIVICRFVNRIVTTMSALCAIILVTPYQFIIINAIIVKKLNSLKHLVRTTVAEKGAIT